MPIIKCADGEFEYVPEAEVVAARTDVLLCVCGTTWKPKPGETLRQLAERLGGGYYPSTTSREGLNYVCPGCDSEGTE